MASQQLQWSYERDECWGPSGEPLLSARLSGEQLMLRVRNSRHYGMEVVIGVAGSAELDGDADGPTFKIGFDDQALQPLQARVQESGQLAFVSDVQRLVAELNCTNRLRLHARPEGGGVWLQLDAEIDDLQLERLVEPDSGILLVYPGPERSAATSSGSSARPAGRAQRPQSAPAARAPSGAADLIGAVAPLAGFALGYKLGHKTFGPSKKGD